MLRNDDNLNRTKGVKTAPIPYQQSRVLDDFVIDSSGSQKITNENKHSLGNLL
jgi:hypothetical protein